MSEHKANAILTSIYTLTPTHCGTGQASGAVDLPIAREGHTGIPILPGTTLKGVVRDMFHLPADRSSWKDEERKFYNSVVKSLFGPLPRERRYNLKDSAETSIEQSDEDPNAGELVFMDAILIAFPIRSLTGTYKLITSPLQIHRVIRLMKAFCIPDTNWVPTPQVEDDEIYLPISQSGPVSLEDLVFEQKKCKTSDWVSRLSNVLANLISKDEDNRDRIEFLDRLVVVSDSVFKDLTIRGTAVSARIVLKADSKTAENLWYEECLPSDCLFAAFIASRPGLQNNPTHRFIDELQKKTTDLSNIYTQIGGNMTVGQGQCRWNITPEVQS